MGSCISTPPPLPLQPPATVAEERLLNASTIHYMWKEFVRDMLLAYDGEEVSMTVIINLTILFDDVGDLDILYTLHHDGIINKNILNSLRTRLLVFMSAPYYYDDDNYLHFYNHVCSCKFYSIKNIVFK